MKNNILVKILIITFMFVLLFDFTTIYAKTNSQYKYNTEQYEADGNSLLSVIADVLMPIIFPFFTAIKDLTSIIMKIFTGTYFFPWTDSIVFNVIPFLDINFINPAPGSLFMNSDGVTYTIVGEVIRKTYFTIFSICITALGIAIAVTTIKLMLSLHRRHTLI